MQKNSLYSISIIWGVVLNTHFSYAQNFPNKDFIISSKAHVGYIISHRSNMAHLIKKHVCGAEIDYTFKTDGTKPWQQIHNYPELGLCMIHLNLGNPQQLGNFEALYPYANLRVNGFDKRVAFNLRIGIGLAYITKSFDRLENHKNNAIGSHLNGFVNLRFGSVIKLGKAWRLETGVGLSHASNGAIKTPNLGLNIATINAGIGYVFGNKNYQIRRNDSLPPVQQRWIPSLIVVWGIKELETPGGAKYSAFGLQLNVHRVLGYKTKLGLGAELAYNSATKQLWANDMIYTSKMRDIVQAGGKIAYEYTIHRVSLPIEFGVYFYKKQPVNGLFFHRIGMRYKLTNHLIANVTLLTHWAKADYFEWGLGYQF